MSRSSSEDAWKSCRIPKSPWWPQSEAGEPSSASLRSSTPNLLTGSPVGNALKWPGSLRAHLEAQERRSSAKSHARATRRACRKA